MERFLWLFEERHPCLTSLWCILTVQSFLVSMLDSRPPPHLRVSGGVGCWCPLRLTGSPPARHTPCLPCPEAKPTLSLSPVLSVLLNLSQDLSENSRSSLMPYDFYKEFWRVICVKYTSDISLSNISCYYFYSALSTHCLANDSLQGLSSQSSKPEEYHSSLCVCFSLQFISDFYSSPDFGVYRIESSRSFLSDFAAFEL